jgi:hypothetical protein
VITLDAFGSVLGRRLDTPSGLSQYNGHGSWFVCGSGPKPLSNKISAPMTERNPRTVQPPHKINYENSQTNFGYVGHPLINCDTAFEFAHCRVKGSLSF